jgi:ParB/RepB/Spo0J family partition protein
MTQETKQPRFENLPLKQLIPTPENPRQINEKTAKFIELLDSVKREGVRVPVMCRPHPTKTGFYDLRAGGKRFRAATIAKCETVPALVYEGMTDIEAFDLTCVENMGREDLLPLEEVQTVATMLEKHDNDYKVVADKLGKPERWVHLRNNVNENLATEWAKEMANEKSIFVLWTISHLELIARFDKNTQVRLLKEMQQDQWTFKKISLKDLQKECTEFVRSLKKAQWKIDEQLTDSKGEALPVCNKCKKRSGCQPQLWDSKTEGGKDDRCLDVACWNNKSTAVLSREVEKQKALHPDLKLIISGGSGCDDDEEEIGKQMGLPIVQRWNLQSAKKDEKGAFPVYTIGGDSAGKILWMKPNKGSSSSSAGTKAKAGGLSLKEKREQLDKKRWFSVLEKLHTQVGKLAINSIVHADKLSTVAVLISMYGTHECQWDDKYEGDKKKEARKNYLGRKNFRDSDECKETLVSLWNMLKPKLLESFHYNGPITQTPDKDIKSGKEIAALVDIDIDAMFKAACEEIKEPKSWKNLEK